MGAKIETGDERPQTQLESYLNTVVGALGVTKRIIYPSLTYDAAGNLVSITVTDIVTGKSYILTLTYDAAGNLISVT